MYALSEQWDSVLWQRTCLQGLKACILRLIHASHGCMANVCIKRSWKVIQTMRGGERGRNIHYYYTVSIFMYSHTQSVLLRQQHSVSLRLRSHRESQAGDQGYILLKSNWITLSITAYKSKYLLGDGTFALLLHVRFNPHINAHIAILF